MAGAAVKDSQLWRVPVCEHGQKAPGHAWAAEFTSPHKSLLMLLEPELSGVFNDWFLCEITREEKDILLFQQWVLCFFTNLLPWILHSFLLWGERKHTTSFLALTSTCAQHLLCMHGQGFSGLHIRFVTSVQFRETTENSVLKEIFGEHSNAGLTQLFCTAERTWNYWHS